MANLWRVRVAWSGSAIVGPGVSTFHFLPDTPGVIAAVKALFQQASNYVPAGVYWAVPNGGEVIDVATGDLVGVFTQAGGGEVVAQGDSKYAAGVGGRIRWETGGFNNGRRVRGATFIVPLSSNIYDSAGTLVDASVTGMQTGINSFLGALDEEFVIYSRGPGPNTGSTALVTAGSLVDRVSWLRSRRT